MVCKTMDEKSDRPKLSHAVQLIRLQTIRTFKSHLEQRGHQIHQKYHAKDVSDESFEETNTWRNHINAIKRKMNRVVNRSATPPSLVSLFVRWILQSKLFKTTINCVVVLSVVVLAIEAEFHDNFDPSLETLHVVLKSLDYCILELFFLEILLKWLDNFCLFWRSPWNIFDFIVTVLPVLPEFLPETSEGAGASHLLKLLIQFRVLRCLKIIGNFREMRFILLTTLKIFQALQYIYLFLVMLIVFYIFAVLGICLFGKYTTSNVQGLLYQDDFRDIPGALITLFSIFTMDHCSGLLKDISRVPELNYPACVLFLIFWFFFGAITLSNISVGLMVDSFQSIRSNLLEEMKRHNAERNAELIQAKVCHSKTMALEHVKEGEGPSANHYIGKCSSSHILTPQEEIEQEKCWNAFIQANELVDKCERVMWHENTLFRYFRLLEKLQRKLEERERLQNVAAQAILNLHDS